MHQTGTEEARGYHETARLSLGLWPRFIVSTAVTTPHPTLATYVYSYLVELLCENLQLWLPKPYYIRHELKAHRTAHLPRFRGLFSFPLRFLPAVSRPSYNVFYEGTGSRNRTRFLFEYNAYHSSSLNYQMPVTAVIQKKR